jgi:hypothetical protein
LAWPRHQHDVFASNKRRSLVETIRLKCYKGEMGLFLPLLSVPMLKALEVWIIVDILSPLALSNLITQNITFLLNKI